MALQYEIKPDLGLVRLFGPRRPDIREVEAVMERVFSDPAFQTGFAFLSDGREMSEAPPREYVEQGLEYLGRNAARLGRCRWASVVSSPSVFGMARMAEFMAGRTSIEFRTFYDEAEALAWLSGHTEDQ